MAKKGGTMLLIAVIVIVGLLGFLFFAPSSVMIEGFQTVVPVPKAPPPGIAPNVMYGPGIGKNVPIQRIDKDNAGNTVYMTYHGGFTKMRNSNGDGKYYTGYIDQYVPSLWPNYTNVGTTTYLTGYSTDPLPPPADPPAGVKPYPPLPVVPLPVTPPSGVGPNVMYGPCIGHNGFSMKPIQKTDFDSAGNTVYITYDDNFTKMVNSKGINKYYTGYIDQYSRAQWDSYGLMGPGTYLVGYIEGPLPPADSPPPPVVTVPTFYEGYGFTGKSAGLPAGTYDITSFDKAFGINKASSIQVPSGYQAFIYDGPIGTNVRMLLSDESDLRKISMDKVVKSVKIVNMADIPAAAAAPAPPSIITLPTFYEGYGFTGRYASLPAGTYYGNDFNTMFGANKASSIQVPSGYQVIVDKSSGVFGGAAVTLLSDESDLRRLNLDKSIQSAQIINTKAAPITAAPITAAAPTGAAVPTAAPTAVPTAVPTAAPAAGAASQASGVAATPRAAAAAGPAPMSTSPVTSASTSTYVPTSASTSTYVPTSASTVIATPTSEQCSSLYPVTFDSCASVVSCRTRVVPIGNSPLTTNSTPAPFY